MMGRCAKGLRFFGPTTASSALHGRSMTPSLAKAPEASKGTWGAYADTGNDDIPVMVLDGTTGSFALRVPHSGAGASRVLVDVSSAGSEEILLANGNGCELA